MRVVLKRVSIVVCCCRRKMEERSRLCGGSLSDRVGFAIHSQYRIVLMTYIRMVDNVYYVIDNVCVSW